MKIRWFFFFRECSAVALQLHFPAEATTPVIPLLQYSIWDSNLLEWILLFKWTKIALVHRRIKTFIHSESTHKAPWTSDNIIKEALLKHLEREVEVVLIYALQKGVKYEYFAFSIKWWENTILGLQKSRTSQSDAVLRLRKFVSIFTSVMESRSAVLNCIFLWCSGRHNLNVQSFMR